MAALSAGSLSRAAIYKMRNLISSLSRIKPTSMLPASLSLFSVIVYQIPAFL